MVAVPGPPPLPELVWEGRLDCRARQFAEAGDDEVKAGHDLELLLRRTIRGDKVGGENTRPERAFFDRERRRLARTRSATTAASRSVGLRAAVRMNQVKKSLLGRAATGRAFAWIARARGSRRPTCLPVSR
jgi:hypothetical protein